MRLWSLLINHSHYYGVPHERPADRRLIQTCYDCGAERVLKVELRTATRAVQGQVKTSESQVLNPAYQP